MLTVGTVVDGKFEIQELLGQGGMGAVYRALHRDLEKNIALKVLKPGLLQDEDKVLRFRNEARLLSSMDHPNIVRVYAVGLAETGQPYMAMDLIAGEPLSDVIARKGRLEEREAVEIAIEICHALQYAHEHQIIHRDIKPSNILFATADDGNNVKLVDFGIAKELAANAQQLTQTGAAVGSIFYLSPHQLEGRKADSRSDIYSLGCTLYEMLTGSPPFAAETAWDTAMKAKMEDAQPINLRNPEASASSAIQSIVDRMLIKDVESRYQSAREVELDLVSALENKPLTFTEMPVRSKTARRLSVDGRRQLVFAGCSVFLAGLVAAGIFAMVSNRQQASTQRTETAEDALSALVRVHTTVHYVPQKGRLLVDQADRTVELCRATGDKLLLIDALMEQVEIYRIAFLQYHVPEIEAEKKMAERILNIDRQAVRLANEAIAQEKDLLRLRHLEQKRLHGQIHLILDSTSANRVVTYDELEQACRYFKVALPKLDVFKKQFYMNHLRTAVISNTQMTLFEFERRAKLRGELLRLMQYSDADLENDLEVMVERLESKGRNADEFLRHGRIAYGLNH